MEIELGKISFQADLYEVKAEFARILHSEQLQLGYDQGDPEDRLMNFHVDLGESDVRRHNGTGTLTIPNRKIAQMLLSHAKRNIVFPSVRDYRILMRDSGRRPNRGMLETLRKVPYQDPKVDRDRDNIILKLDVSWRVDQLQFGLWLRRPSLKYDTKRVNTFAVEWEKDYTAVGNAQLTFEFVHKEIRLLLGDPSLDEVSHSVVIKFSNIQRIWTGYEFKPFVYFDLLTPAIFETEWFNRTITGVRSQDTQKFRQRIGALDEYHRRIGPYAFQIRLTLYQGNDLDEFVRSCSIAGLRRPIEATITSEKHEFFSQEKLMQVQRSFHSFRDLPWTTTFQIECLLHNGFLTTTQYLNGLRPSLIELARSHPDIMGIILRDYTQKLSSETREFDSPKDVTKSFESFWKSRVDLRPIGLGAHVQHEGEGLMACHHVTFTPTRMLLEGPYVTQSNRILRRYSKYNDYFLRVDFRDEDHLQYRWDREVDGSTFVRDRVGKTLKNGFELAGRHFEFLAYSSSALRDHAVWFVSPFFHPEEGHVNAASIRRKVGDFTNNLLYPAKYGARLALAFTATDPSVKITKSQWIEIPDLGTKPYIHTDGAGTMSRELGRLIWKELCRLNPSLANRLEPWAYQIRFLGYKGVIVVDESLAGVQLCLRPSMRKFEAHEVEVADIEIAKAFFAPGTMYLNRPLVMILEDQGVRKNVFLDLLDEAIRDVRLACDTINYLTVVMKSHGLGSTFGSSSLLLKLSSFGMDLHPSDPSKSIRSPFIDRLVNCTIGSVLRDIQFRCRIPVPKSWSLVGVADEGNAYIERGKHSADEVFTLREGEIFACVQKDPDSNPEYLKGICIISRSPTYYPGDVQRVIAVGKPPDGKVCAFRNLINVVVFPSGGKGRSLASKLSGGDLDGDSYNICQYERMFGPRSADDPGNFPPVPLWGIDRGNLEYFNEKTGETELDPEKVIPYVCDFVVDYINSDVLGLLSDNHLVRADQSSEGVRDLGCLLLAELCNQAVDYPRNGIPVNIANIPGRLIPYKPDWKRGEGDDDHKTDFYRSERAVGEIFRITEKIMAFMESEKREPSVCIPAAWHPIHVTLEPKVKIKLQGSGVAESTVERVRKLFVRFSEELKYICATHTLSDRPSVRLSEEEVVIGTILAPTSQHRWRNERIYRMRVHASNLEKEIKDQFMPKKLQNMSTKEVQMSLEFAWTSWKLMTDKLSTEEAKRNSFGLNSFSFIALNVVLECLDFLDKK